MRRLIYVEIPQEWAQWRTYDSQTAREIPERTFATLRYRLKEMVDSIRELGAEPVVMTLPTILSDSMRQAELELVHYPRWANANYKVFNSVVRRYNEMLRSFAADHGTLLIDNAEFIDSLGRLKEEIFKDTLHMRCEGYGLLASNIAKELKKADMVR